MWVIREILFQNLNDGSTVQAFQFMIIRTRNILKGLSCPRFIGNRWFSVSHVTSCVKVLPCRPATVQVNQWNMEAKRKCRNSLNSNEVQAKNDEDVFEPRVGFEGPAKLPVSFPSRKISHESALNYNCLSGFGRRMRLVYENLYVMIGLVFLGLWVYI